MIQSKQKVKDVCDELFHVKPEQIVIDLIQDEIEELLTSDDVTPDDIGAATYVTSLLIDIYNPVFKTDIEYLKRLHNALVRWGNDATFANKTLGLDPNK